MKTLFLFFFLSLISYAHADITTGLVGWWKMDDGNGTTAVDSGSGGNNGTLVNSPTWVVGRSSGAVSFVSASLQYITFGVGTQINQTEGTVSTWFNSSVDLTGGGANVPLFTVGATGQRLDLYPSGGNIYAGWFKPANDDRVVWPVSGIPINTWHQAVVTWINGGTTSLYVDGILKGTTGSLDATFDTTAMVRYCATEVALVSFATVIIDDMRVYNRALTQSDVTQLYGRRRTVVIN